MPNLPTAQDCAGTHALAEAWSRRLSPTVPTSRSSRRRASGGSTSSARARSTAPGSRSTSTSIRSTTRTSSRATSARRSTSTTDYLFVVLHFPRYDKVVGRLNAAELDVFVGPDFVVTLPNEPLQPLEYLFERCRAREDVRDALFAKGAGYLLYKIVDDCVDSCFPMLNKMGNKLEHIEDDIFEGRSSEVVRDDLQREAGDHQLPQDRPPAALGAARPRAHAQRYLPEDLEVYFDDIRTRTSASGTSSRTTRRSSRRSRRRTSRSCRTSVNDILRVLTAFSVIVLPLTLIASVAGMNVHFPGFEQHRRVLGDHGRDVRRARGDGQLLPVPGLAVGRRPQSGLTLGRASSPWHCPGPDRPAPTAPPPRSTAGSAA